MRAIALSSSCLVVLLMATACAGDPPPESDESLAAKCGAGTEFNKTTKKCEVPEAGSLGDTEDGSGSDATGGGSDGATTGKDGSGSGSDNGSGDDATEEVIIPWDTATTCDPKAPPAEQWWNCPPAKTAGTKNHGQKCEKDEECSYGRCMFGMPQAGYDKAVGFCTKNCGYTGGGGPATSCYTDDTAKDKFYCALEIQGAKFGGKNPKNDKTDPNRSVYKACTRGCKSDAECAVYNPEMPICIKFSTDYLGVNPSGSCGKNPP